MFGIVIIMVEAERGELTDTILVPSVLTKSAFEPSKTGEISRVVRGQKVASLV